MDQVSFLLQLSFILITLLSVFLLYRADHRLSKTFLIITSVWMVIQTAIGLTDFYTDTSGIPPRFALLIIPPTLLLLFTFVLERGREFLDNLNLKSITLLHIIRFPVEIVLYYLFLAGTIPEEMTFAGRNFDIIMGLTAPLLYYFAFNKKYTHQILLVWNILGVILLVNIVVVAILSTTTPLQQFGFDQPNIAIAHFPFNFLPSIVVPIVFLAHFAAIRHLRELIKMGKK